MDEVLISRVLTEGYEGIKPRYRRKINMTSEYIYKKQGIELHYFEIRNNLQPLVLIHAQGVDATSFENLERLFKIQ